MPAFDSPVSLDHERIASLSAWLRTHNIPNDREDAPLHGFTPAEATNFWFALVAICHQTSPTGKPPLEGIIDGVHLRGWDYLKGAFERAARADKHLLDPSRWITLTATWFVDTFGDSLTDPSGRASLLQDLGLRMLSRRLRSLSQLVQQCDGRIRLGSPNLTDSLSSFRAYDDPVHKKSYFLLSLLRNSGLCTYKDPQNLGPPVDYHEVRGHLRIGTIVITDPSLLEKIVSGVEVAAHEDIAIRLAVHDAILLLSTSSELNSPSQLHYLFWNVFRSHCTRISPKCDAFAALLPHRYQHLTNDNGHTHCPFTVTCRSYADHDFTLRDHVCSTDYY